MPMTKRLITASIRDCKMRCLVLISFLLIACMQAPSLGQSAKTERAEEKAPLRYRLIVSKPTVCAKESINLELELENISNHDVLVDPRALLHTIDISRKGGAVVSTGDPMGQVTPDQFIPLAPGKSYRKNSSYPLQGRFFSAVGLYSIHLTYGQFADPSPKLPDLYIGAVDSNTVLFEINDCG